MHIGLNIYTLRKQSGLTQAGLAERLGVTEQAVSKWETGQCAPDVSLFPGIAELFGVSIDRIFGYEVCSLEQIGQILAERDAAEDVDKECEILETGLARFPGTSKLKLELAWSLLQKEKITEDETARRAAVDRALRLYEEAAESADAKIADTALAGLAELFIRRGEFERAERSIGRISADRFDLLIRIRLQLLEAKKATAEQAANAEELQLKLWVSLLYTMEQRGSIARSTGDSVRALAFCRARAALADLFAAGCADFFLPRRLWIAYEEAQLCREQKDKAGCLAALKRFLKLAAQSQQEADNWHIAHRNPAFFPMLSDPEAMEPHMPKKLVTEQLLAAFDRFFGADAEYHQLKEAQ